MSQKSLLQNLKDLSTYLGQIIEQVEQIDHRLAMENLNLREVISGTLEPSPDTAKTASMILGKRPPVRTMPPVDHSEVPHTPRPRSPQEDREMESRLATDLEKKLSATDPL